MDQISSIEAIAQVIQLAVAPVFLIAGIAGLLNVLSARLGRIIDRARYIELKVVQVHGDNQQLLRAEASALWLRVRLTFWSIRLCVSAALMICFVIVALFIGDLIVFNLSVLIAILFVIAMAFLTAGLACFLREVSISARGTRQDMEAIVQGGPSD
jgi:hypothetical protein